MSASETERISSGETEPRIREAPRPGSLGVDPRSQARKDLRKGLRLVQHQQPLRPDELLPLEVEPQAFRLELEVEVGASEHAGQGRLPDLARAEERGGGLLSQSRAKSSFCETRQHA